MTIAGESSPSTGRESKDTKISLISIGEQLNQLISSVADSHVSQSAMLANDSPKTMNDGCGQNLNDVFAHFDHDLLLWKTYQASLFEEWATFSEVWPRAGMMRNGKAYRLLPLVPRISATGFGYLPTPDASLGAFLATGMMDITSSFRLETENGKRPSGAKIGSSLRWCQELIRERLRTGGEINPEWIEVLMGYPTGHTELKDWATPSSRKSRKR